MLKVAINGLGRIGRIALKQIIEHPQLEVVAVNDVAPLENLIYLLRYDSVYGRYHKSVDIKDGKLEIDGEYIRSYNEKDPRDLPWAKLEVDLVLECTGVFRSRVEMEKHIEAGSKRVMLSAPAKDGGVPSIVYGVNELEDPETPCISTASCTTNCIVPVMEIMHRRVGVKKAILNTVHAYTASQGAVDKPASRMERGRAIGLNIIPTSTGAASATAEVLPEYEGRFDGCAIRVPVACGSISDITFVTNRETSAQELNDIFKEEAVSSRYRDIVGVTEDPVVSTDIIGDARAAIIDTRSTLVVGGDLVKVLAWYDNEWGYVSQMLRHAASI